MSVHDDGNHDNKNGNGRGKDNRDWPQTVDEAVDRLLVGLSDKDKETVRSTPKDELYKFHFGWGMGIRNGFGLWQGNAALMKSCAKVSGREYHAPR